MVVLALVGLTKRYKVIVIPPDHLVGNPATFAVYHHPGTLLDKGLFLPICAVFTKMQ